MKLTAKSRYALTVLIEMGLHEEDGACLSAVWLAQHLNISKIYLEQVFSILRNSKLVTSLKGPGGGYKLAKHPNDISVFDIILPFETGIFEYKLDAIHDDAPAMCVTLEESLMHPLNDLITDYLKNISLQFLIEHTDEVRGLL
jgi:Rrf2 family protein